MTDPNMGRPAISSSWPRGFIGPAPPDQQLTSPRISPPRGFIDPAPRIRLANASRYGYTRCRFSRRSPTPHRTDSQIIF